MRLCYIDNLRSTLVVFVISMHAADTYSPLGNWYFTDRVPLTTSVLLFFAAWQMFLQAFFMGLLFFIAGLFVPGSLDRKGPLAFARERLWRLGLPVLFYMFFLGPVTEYYLARSWTSTQPTSFANEWLKHIRNGEFLQENGPLWFCLALLIFSLTYAAVRKFKPPSPSVSPSPLPQPRTLRTTGTPWPPPGTAVLFGFALILAAATFLVRLGRPPILLNMHLSDFAQYILLFTAGILVAQQQWLSKLSFQQGITWLVSVTTLGLAAWVALIVMGGALEGHTDPYSGGWHWQSAALDSWESFTCVGLSLGLLVLFREYLNYQGRLAKLASDNAFSIYVFHPPVVIALARVLHLAPWHPLLKFVVLTLSATVTSFVLSAVIFRRIPGLRTIL